MRGRSNERRRGSFLALRAVIFERRGDKLYRQTPSGSWTIASDAALGNRSGSFCCCCSSHNGLHHDEKNGNARRYRARSARSTTRRLRCISASTTYLCCRPLLPLPAAQQSVAGFSVIAQTAVRSCRRRCDCKRCRPVCTRFIGRREPAAEMTLSRRRRPPRAYYYSGWCGVTEPQPNK